MILRVSPAERNHRHEQYDQYITAEVVPFVRGHCNDDQLRIMTNGCSMGAYHAVNFFLRHPDLFAGTIALSGLYRLDRQEFGMNADDIAAVYYNSPVSYLPGTVGSLVSGSAIVRVRSSSVWAREPGKKQAIEDTRALDHIFRDKGISAWIDYWGHDVNHDWPWWYKQMNYFLERLYG